MNASRKLQFSIKRLMGVTTAFTVAIAVAAMIHPGLAVLVSFVGILVCAFVLLTEPPAWLRFGVPIIGAVFGLTVGILLYQSAIPGMLYGLLAGIAIVYFVSKASAKKRIRTFAFCSLLALGISLLPLGYFAGHYHARYMLWTSGVRFVEYPRDNNYDSRWKEWVGPYFVEYTNSMRFRDDPVRWGGIMWTDEKMKRLQPHFGRLVGIDDISVTSDTMTDDGFRQLADVRGLKDIGIVSKSISTEGLRAIKDVENVDSVLLRCPQVGDEVVELLRGYPKLRCLYLDESSVSDTATQEFADFKKLHQFTVPTAASDATIKKLKNTIVFPHRLAALK